MYPCGPPGNWPHVDLALLAFRTRSSCTTVPAVSTSAPTNRRINPHPSPMLAPHCGGLPDGLGAVDDIDDQDEQDHDRGDQGDHRRPDPGPERRKERPQSQHHSRNDGEEKGEHPVASLQSAEFPGLPQETGAHPGAAGPDQGQQRTHQPDVGSDRD